MLGLATSPFNDPVDVLARRLTAYFNIGPITPAMVIRLAYRIEGDPKDCKTALRLYRGNNISPIARTFATTQLGRNAQDWEPLKRSLQIMIWEKEEPEADAHDTRLLAKIAALEAELTRVEGQLVDMAKWYEQARITIGKLELERNKLAREKATLSAAPPAVDEEMVKCLRKVIEERDSLQRDLDEAQATVERLQRQEAEITALRQEIGRLGEQLAAAQAAEQSVQAKLTIHAAHNGVHHNLPDEPALPAIRLPRGCTVSDRGHIQRKGGWIKRAKA